MQLYNYPPKIQKRAVIGFWGGSLFPYAGNDGLLAMMKKGKDKVE